MDKKISELDLVTTLDSGDVLPIVNQATTKKVTVAKIIDGLATTAYVNSQDALKVDKIVGKGLSTEDYTTTEKTKLFGIAEGAEVNVNADWNSVSGDSQILNKPTISGTNTGDQNLQQVTDIGNITNKTIIANVALGNPAITGYSSTGFGVYGQSSGIGVYGYTFGDRAVYGYAESVTGIAVSGYSEDGVGAEFETDATNVNTNIVNFKKSGVLKAYVNNGGELIAQKLIKDGGTSAQFLMADGSVSTGGLVTQTSQLTNNGADGVNPFITALDIPVAGQASTLVREVKNMTGATLTKGTVVYISGANGNKALVSKALATTDALSSRTFGMLQSDILNNGLGNCVVIGDLTGLNTSTFAEGDQLYLSGVTAGTYTASKILAPTHLVYVGKVTRVHPTLGQIEVGIQNGYELEEIHDVAISGLANEDFLQYELSTDLWKNKPLTDTLIKSKLGITTLSGSNTGDNATNTQYSGLATSKQNVITLTTTGTSGASTLIGDTLNIPEYGTPPQSAYTILANNTNATAVPTTQVYKDVGEQSYAGATPTWTGITAPSGATNHSYQWSQIGKVVNLRVNLDYATAGTTLTAVTFDLPSDCPIPKLPLGVSANGDVIAYGNGMLTALRAVPTTPTTVVCTLRIKTTGTYEINIIRNTALGHKYAYATIQYFAQ